MDFLCDVHIPLKLVKYLISCGHSTYHVNQLPNKWYTSDSDICLFADKQSLIVVTKDEDFRNSFLLRKTPRKLVRIVLGNISNHDLIQLIEKNLSTILKLDDLQGFYLELGKSTSVYTF